MELKVDGNALITLVQQVLQRLDKIEQRLEALVEQTTQVREFMARTDERVSRQADVVQDLLVRVDKLEAWSDQWTALVQRNHFSRHETWRKYAVYVSLAGAIAAWLALLFRYLSGGGG